MAIATMPGSRGKRNVAVEFAATDAVADVEGLCAWLREEIERHLLSIQEVPIDGWNLTARIETCRMEPNFGAVRVGLSGMIDGRPVEDVIAVEDRPPPAGYTIKEQTDDEVRLAFANLFTFLGRLFFPSKLVRVLGHRRVSGRLIRAWCDCCREIRILIDTTIGRPESGGRQMLWKTMKLAVRAGLFFTALSVVEKLLFHRQQADDFRSWVACGMIGIGMFGAIASSGLLFLPFQFFQAEEQGLALAKLFGVKGLAGIRAVAFGLLLISLAFGLIPGVCWLLAD